MRLKRASAARISPQLDLVLKEVLSLVPPPNGGTDWQAALNRNRAIQELLMSKALLAAEAVYPGLTELMQELGAAEMSFMQQAGPQA